MGLGSVELVMALEEEFGVRIPDSEAEQMLTPRHVIDWMCAQQEQGALFSAPGSKAPRGFQGFTREEIAERVREIVREQLGVEEFSNDDRFMKGKIYAIAADATFVIAGITAITAVYYTFRDKGPPSSGLIDVRSFALSPQIGPGYAGLGMGVSF